MRYRRFSPAHEATSAIGLGCVGLTSEYIDADWDPSEAVDVLRGARDFGVSLFDTADSYGPYENERLIGGVLGGANWSPDVVISTKVGFVYGDSSKKAAIDGSPEHIARSCRESLSRLQVECIDMYYLHRVDPNIPAEESWGAMKSLVDAGLVKEIGICEVGVDVLDAVHRIHPVASVQSELSLWTKDALDDVVPWTVMNGASFVAYSPLGRGFLTGSITSANFDAEDIRAGNPRFSDRAIEHNLGIVEAIRAIAAPRGATAAQVAIAWLLALSPNIFAIPGTKRVSYLSDNCAAADLELSAEDMDVLSNLPRPFGDRY